MLIRIRIRIRIRNPDLNTITSNSSKLCCFFWCFSYASILTLRIRALIYQLNKLSTNVELCTYEEDLTVTRKNQIGIISWLRNKSKISSFILRNSKTHQCTKNCLIFLPFQTKIKNVPRLFFLYSRYVCLVRNHLTPAVPFIETFIRIRI